MQARFFLRPDRLELLLFFHTEYTETTTTLPFAFNIAVIFNAFFVHILSSQLYCYILNYITYIVPRIYARVNIYIRNCRISSSPNSPFPLAQKNLAMLAILTENTLFLMIYRQKSPFFAISSSPTHLAIFTYFSSNLTSTV